MNCSKKKVRFMTSSTEKRSDENVCEYDENLSVLRSIPLFREVPLDSMQALAYLCKRMRYKQGDALFVQDDEDDKAYYIVEGEAQLMHRNTDGEHKVGTYAPGDFIGGLSLLSKTRRLFTLTAKTDLQCIILERRKLPSDPEKATAFLLAYGRAISQSVVDWEQSILAQAEASGAEDDILQKLRLGVSLV